MRNKIIATAVAVSMLSSVPAFSADTMMMNTESTMMNSSAEVWVMVWWASMVPSKNIVENALWSDDHTTLVAAVWAAWLVDALQTDWPFTVFAPTNSAFAKLPAGTVDTLLMEENKRMLTGILTYHVVAWAYTSSNLEDGMRLTTLQWDSIEITYKNENWYVNNALIEIADVISSNWVTYVVDSVIMPSDSYESRVKKALEIRGMLDVKIEAKIDNVVMKYNNISADLTKDKKDALDTKFMMLIDWAIEKAKQMWKARSVNIFTLLKLELMNNNSAWVMVGWAAMLPSMNIVENALGSKDHTTLVAAVTAGWLADALQAEGPLTVFAPTNVAFGKLPSGTVETLVMPENKDDLVNILTYHVVAGSYLASDLKDGLELTTLQGTKLMFTVKAWVVHINGEAMVETANVISSNWVTHVVDSVLIPTE